MEKYNRGEIVDKDAALPYAPGVVDEDVPHVKVQTGSKIRNLLNFALPAIEEKTQLMVSGSGPAITKVITVAELIKRKLRGLDQWNKIGYKKVLEYWDPQEEGMSRLQVTREIPVMHILLSKTPLDDSLPGVQKALAKNDKQQQRVQRNKVSKGGGRITKRDAEVRGRESKAAEASRACRGDSGKVARANASVAAESEPMEEDDEHRQKGNEAVKKTDHRNPSSSSSLAGQRVDGDDNRSSRLSGAAVPAAGKRHRQRRGRHERRTGGGGSGGNEESSVMPRHRNDREETGVATGAAGPATAGTAESCTAAASSAGGKAPSTDAKRKNTTAGSPQ